MDLTTDSRCTGDFANKLEWSGLDTLYEEAISIIKSASTATLKELETHSEIIIANGVTKEALEGIVLSFEDLKKETEKVRKEHCKLKGAVDSSDYDEYMHYLTIASEYQSIMENTTALTSSSIMDVLNTVELNTIDTEIKEITRNNIKTLSTALEEETEGLIKDIDKRMTK